MKAPYKIYIAETPNKLIEIWSEKPIESKPYITEHEYIRKDALLDKLNLALKLRGDDNPNINDDGVQTIKAMINYIESL